MKPPLMDPMEEDKALVRKRLHMEAEQLTAVAVVELRRIGDLLEAIRDFQKTEEARAGIDALVTEMNEVEARFRRVVGDEKVDAALDAAFAEAAKRRVGTD